MTLGGSQRTMKIGRGADALFSSGHRRRALRLFVISHHRCRILHCNGTRLPRACANFCADEVFGDGVSRSAD